MTNLEELKQKMQKLVEEGKFLEVILETDEAIKIHEDDPDLWNLKGIALRGLGRYDEAVECFSKSLQIKPTDNSAS